MRRALPSILFAFVLAAAPGCRSRKKSASDEAVIATVNGETLSRADFQRELESELDFAEGALPPSPEQLQPLKKQLLEETVDHALLLQAAKERNVTVPPDDVDREVLKMSSDFPADGFTQALAQSQMSLAQFKQKTAERLTIRKLFEEHVYPRVGVTEEALRAYYSAHVQEFEEPEEVHAEQIVVKDLEDARRIQVQLKAGKRFQDLARKFSLSADARVGGDLGFFKRGDMPPEFDEVAFRLPIGQTSDVVSTEYGFHIFRVLEKRPAQKKELSHIRDDVERRLVKQKRQDAQNEFIQALRKKAQLWVNEPVVRAVTGQRHAVDAAAARGH